MSSIYLLLGANLEDRFHQLSNAFHKIEEKIGSVIKYSSIYETAAWGKEDEPSYLNQVLCVSTNLAPHELLKTIHEIENSLGRTRQLRWESRLIDIDILFYNELIINDLGLIIPHPYLHKRKFTLVPLAEIAPEYTHPVLLKSIQQLLVELADPLMVNKLSEEGQ
jgi:2-amino-4-hydroxy-6-hydroxymethyldihydropteridine diphosphokinase